MMDLFWLGGDGPKDIPSSVYLHLVNTFHLSNDDLTGFRTVLSEGFEGGKAVTYFRVFNPNADDEAWHIRDFASLDEKPHLIIYEGYMENEGEYVFLEKR
jgi:hypothetical protein